MELISFTFEVFHLDISGKDKREEHFPNILFMTLTLAVFHLEISGIEITEAQL